MTSDLNGFLSRATAGGLSLRPALVSETGSESPGAGAASLSEEPSLSPHEKKFYGLAEDRRGHALDEIAENLEAELSSSEILAAMFELERPGRAKQLPGKIFVRSFL